MSRKNSDRMGGHRQSNAMPPSSPTQQAGAFSFVVPTDFVDLPSKGAYYSANHPLYNKDVLEIKHMTAKEEDILTSKVLLKKGIAIDRVIANVIVDKSIDPNSLLVGDRNAIVIALRAASYGSRYETKVVCPACQTKVEFAFDLEESNVYSGEDTSAIDIARNEDSTFDVELPATKIMATFRLLTGRDEKTYLSNLEQDKKSKAGEKAVTRQLMTMLVAANGDDRIETRRYVAQNLPSKDSRHLRLAYKLVNPNIDLTQDFECSSCGFEEPMEVPLGADFFWPDR